MRLHINPVKDFKTFGDRSLEGTLLSSGWDGKEDIKLDFHETTQEWREKNGGPALAIVPEFAFSCLVESINNLARRGIQITVIRTYPYTNGGGPEE